jgi:hypothetical protein
MIQTRGQSYKAFGSKFTHSYCKLRRFKSVKHFSLPIKQSSLEKRVSKFTLKIVLKDKVQVPYLQHFIYLQT